MQWLALSQEALLKTKRIIVLEIGYTIEISYSHTLAFDI